MREATRRQRSPRPSGPGGSASVRGRSCASADADRGADDLDDALLHLDRHARPKRNGEVLLGDVLRVRQRAGLVAAEAERGLEVARRRVVDPGCDAGIAERRADAVALWRAADEQGVDVARLVPRPLDEPTETELPA